VPEREGGKSNRRKQEQLIYYIYKLIIYIIYGGIDACS
jgi:hypothetical protein